MADLNEIVNFLDEELKIGEIPDYPGALNGLQLENAGVVTKVMAAVDASLPVIRHAVEDGADLLVVHHGMFWHGAQRLVAAQYEKLKIAMDAGLAIYSAHIPLDIHPCYGNNALLCEVIGMREPEPFHEWKGVKIGLKQRLELSLDELLVRVGSAVDSHIHCCRGRMDEACVGMVGVITGGAGSEVQAMADAGIDTFITGEGPHWSFPLAEELGVNLIYAGHYSTETFGVRRLSAHLADKFALAHGFLHHPTGL